LNTPCATRSINYKDVIYKHIAWSPVIARSLGNIAIFRIPTPPEASINNNKKRGNSGRIMMLREIEMIIQPTFGPVNGVCSWVIDENYHV